MDLREALLSYVVSECQLLLENGCLELVVQDQSSSPWDILKMKWDLEMLFVRPQAELKEHIYLVRLEHGVACGLIMVYEQETSCIYLGSLTVVIRVYSSFGIMIFPQV